MTKTFIKTMEKNQNTIQSNKNFSILRTYYDNDPYEALQGSYTRQIIPFSDYISLMQEQLLNPMPNFGLTNNASKLFRIKFEYGFSIETTPREELLKERLHGEYWLISDSELLAKITSNEVFNSKEAIPFIIDYYKIDNWNKLKEMVQSWKPIIDDERLQVFESAIENTCTGKSNIHLLTVPSLIGQIEGLLNDLKCTIPSSVEELAKKTLKNRTYLKDENKESKKRIFEESVWEIVRENSLTWFLEYAIHEGLFRNFQDSHLSEDYSLFRHKIMHGKKQYIKSCNEENFLRLFLYADFIITLINEVLTKSKGYKD